MSASNTMDFDTGHDVPIHGEARAARWTLRLAMLGLSALLAWAWHAQIQQVTRAPAQVIASARTQVVQSAESGVLTTLSVKEGDRVKAGQVLATLERARAQAAVDESRSKVIALQITLARLRAEAYGGKPEFTPEMLSYKEYIRNQTDLYTKRQRAIAEDVAALEKARKLAQAELDMNQSLEKTGDVSKADLLKLQRQVADIEAQIVNKRNKYFQDVQAEMTKAQEDLQAQTEQLRDRSQVLEHTTLTAPMDGVVKELRVVTLGAAIRPGDIIMELLPDTDDLIVEAKVSPADIAFIEMGQKANVKFDAYDFSIFGGMQGEVSYISADTLKEETRQGPNTYYRVHVRIHDTGALRQAAQAAQQGQPGSTAASGKTGPGAILVRPGMTAQVDIRAMDRSVLSYLTKPVMKTLSQSMGER